MMKSWLFGLLVTFSFANAIRPLDPAIAHKIKSGLQDAGLMPDILPDFEPTALVKIKYPEKVVDLGTEVRPAEAVEPPLVFFRAPSPDAQYTLIMIDADTLVPLVRHWAATNIQGRNFNEALTTASPLHVYTLYHGPTPPDDGKLHRYVFSLWEQQSINQTFLPILESPTANRAFFNLTQFTENNHLTPITATYMLTSHQEGYQGTYISTHGGDP